MAVKESVKAFSSGSWRRLTELAGTEIEWLRLWARVTGAESSVPSEFQVIAVSARGAPSRSRVVRRASIGWGKATARGPRRGTRCCPAFRGRGPRGAAGARGARDLPIALADAGADLQRGGQQLQGDGACHHYHDDRADPPASPNGPRESRGGGRVRHRMLLDRVLRQPTAQTRRGTPDFQLAALTGLMSPPVALSPLGTPFTPPVRRPEVAAAAAAGDRRARRAREPDLG